MNEIRYCHSLSPLCEKKVIETFENFDVFLETTDDARSKFCRETYGCGILDSGCSKNVCGVSWLDAYLDTLSEDDLKLVEYKESDATFKFGNPTIYSSIHQVTFPARIGSKNVDIIADVIDVDIPLLISKIAMKKANTIIDFKNDKVTMFGETISVRFTSTGHYCVCLNKVVEVAHNEDNVIRVYFANLEKMDTMTSKDKEKAAIKLHKQFCHVPANRINKLLVNAGVQDKEMFKTVELISENCKTCKEFSRVPPKPVVALPSGKIFNQHVAMDLKTINEKHILHLIDHATRYSRGCIVPNKEKSTIVSGVLKIWISLFGSPKSILSDNGGEFSNEELVEIGQKLNTEIKSTAAESPWSNGMNERHNGILGEMILKTMNDCKCDLQTALMWSLAAKNSLANVYGFSPQQLVFGQNASFPSNLHNKLPALDENFSSAVMRDNLNVLHAARENFIKLESCAKVKKALRSKTRTHTAKTLEIGHKVYYKRNGSEKWRGVAKIVGFDGETVLVKEGGLISKVHSCRIVLENAEFANDDMIETSELSDENTQRKGTVDAIVADENTDDDEDDDNDHCAIVDVEPRRSARNDDSVVGVNEVEVSAASVPTVEHTENMNDVAEGNLSDGQTTKHKSHQGNSGSSRCTLPKKNSTLIAKTTENDEYQRLKVIGRGGKASGKYSSFINVLDETNNELKCIDWNGVKDWRELPAEEVLISDEFKPDDLLGAKLKEFSRWNEYGVFTEVENVGQKCITTRWVNTVKDGVIKSRLVARGYEDTELKERVDSPTCEKSNLRLTISIAASMGWRINSLDVQSAFLQGEEVEGDIYLQPPKEANTNKLWKLRKYVYGLKQASRKWYLKISKELKTLGAKMSKMDEAFFFWYHEGKLAGLVAGHVDDFFWCGSDEFKTNVIDKIMSSFQISSDLHESFTFLGLKVHQLPSGIILNQDNYADKIQYLTQHTNASKLKELSCEDRDSLRSAIGQLSWIGNQTRPDVSSNVCQLSSNLKNATKSDVTFANKTIRKVRVDKLSLKFPKLDLSNLQLLVHSDASHNNLPNGGSQGGYIIFLGDQDGRVAPIQWQSKRIKRVVKSTLAAECLALEEAVDHAFYIKCMISEIMNVEIPMHCSVDCQSLCDNLHSSNNVKEDKRLIQDIALLKEMMMKNEINSVKHVSSKNNLADALTKRGASCQLLDDVLSSGCMKTYQT